MNFEKHIKNRTTGSEASDSRKASDILSWLLYTGNPLKDDFEV